MALLERVHWDNLIHRLRGGVEGGQEDWTVIFPAMVGEQGHLVQIAGNGHCEELGVERHHPHCRVPLVRVRSQFRGVG